MKCPYCQHEMQSGWLQSKERIVYSNQKKKFPFPIATVADFIITENLISPHACPVFFCPDCKKNVIDVSGKADTGR